MRGANATRPLPSIVSRGNKMNLWNTPADPDFDLFPDTTEEELKEALGNIDFEEIYKKMEEDEEFQKRLRAFRPRPLSVEDWLRPIY